MTSVVILGIANSEICEKAGKISRGTSFFAYAIRIHVSFNCYFVFLISDADLEDFIVKIVQATNRGISAVKNVTRSNPNWSFGQSVFFAGTVITTIGELVSIL